MTNRTDFEDLPAILAYPETFAACSRCSTEDVMYHPTKMTAGDLVPRHPVLVCRRGHETQGMPSYNYIVTHGATRRTEAVDDMGEPVRTQDLDVFALMVEVSR